MFVLEVKFKSGGTFERRFAEEIEAKQELARLIQGGLAVHSFQITPPTSLN